MISKHFQFLILASLVNGICFSMLLPLLAPLVRQLQLSELQGGVIVSAAAIAMTLASLFKAKATDSISPFKLIVRGFCGMTITWAIFAGWLYWGLHGVTGSILVLSMLILSRAGTGCYMAYVQIGIQSAVMQMVDLTSERSKSMAALGAANSLGMILGPLFTSVLVMYGILTPVWFVVVLFSIVTLILHQYFNAANPQVEIHHREIKPKLQQDIEPLMVWQQHSMWLLLGFVLAMAIVTLNMTAGFYIQDQFGLSALQSATQFAQCLVIVAMVLLLCQFILAGYLKIALLNLVLMGCMSMIVGLVLSVCADTILQFKLSYIFYGLAVACLTPAFSTGAAQSVKRSLQLKMASYCTAAQAMGFVFAPIVSTALYQISPAMPFYLLLFCMLCFLFYFGLMAMLKSPKLG